MADYEELSRNWEIGLVFPGGERLYAQELAAVEDYDCDVPFDVYAADAEGKLIGCAAATAGDGFVESDGSIDWRGVIDTAGEWDDLNDGDNSVFRRLAEELDEAESVDASELYDEVFEAIV